MAVKKKLSWQESIALELEKERQAPYQAYAKKAEDTFSRANKTITEGANSIYQKPQDQ